MATTRADAIREAQKLAVDNNEAFAVMYSYFPKTKWHIKRWAPIAAAKTQDEYDCATEDLVCIVHENGEVER